MQKLVKETSFDGIGLVDFFVNLDYLKVIMTKTHRLNIFSHFLLKPLYDILVRKALMGKLD